MRIISLLLFSFLFWQTVPAQKAWQAKVDRQILDKVQRGIAEDFLVVLSSQADLSAAQKLNTKEEKGRYVFERLQAVAEKSQPPVLAILKASGYDYRSFFIVNAVHVRQGDLSVLKKIASLEAVSEVQADPWVKFDEPVKDETNLNFRSELTWGLQKIDAQTVWDLGYKGQGVVIGGQDTGYDWSHPALKISYRGWKYDEVRQQGEANHNYNWYDAIHEISPLHNEPEPSPDLNPCGLDSKTPCDDHNHGTHTMGTMTGNDASGVQIGLAPSARWIGCRNMERGWGRPSSYMECFEWFLAPSNVNGEKRDPRYAPHVINNSWSCPEREGCNSSNWETMEKVIKVLRAAGIVVVVSAGNSGSRGCSSIGDAPAIFEGSFAVGSSTVNDEVSGFSSKGPVLAYRSRSLKPNVVAPGSGVYSATRNGGYATWSGTSMAGPHVAGAVAIIISANPRLAGQVERIETILEQSATPIFTAETCASYSGSRSPNPFSGYGRIDLQAAVERARSPFPFPGFPSDLFDLQVFPNPTFSDAIFQLGEWRGNLQVRLTDAMGRIVQQEEWVESEGLQKKMNLQNLPEGLYFYHLNGRDYIWNGTLIKN